MMSKYIRNPPAPTDLNFLITQNKTPENIPIKLLEYAEFLNAPDQIDDFLDEKSNWYHTSKTNFNRLALLSFFSQFSCKQHSEMIISEKYKEIIPIPIMVAICSKQQHKNLSILDKQSNCLLTIQGYLIHNF